MARVLLPHDKTSNRWGHGIMAPDECTTAIPESGHPVIRYSVDLFAIRPAEEWVVVNRVLKIILQLCLAAGDFAWLRGVWYRRILDAEF